LVEVAPEHERRAVAMGLAELIARRDVGHLVGEAQVLEPGRLADMEMIDRMEVVVEARFCDLPCRQPATIGEPAFHQENVETGSPEVSAEDQAVMAGADDDAVIASLKRRRHLPYSQRRVATDSVTCPRNSFARCGRRRPLRGPRRACPLPSPPARRRTC